MKRIILALLVTICMNATADTYWSVMRSDPEWWKTDYPRFANKPGYGLNMRSNVTCGYFTLQDMLVTTAQRERFYNKDSAVLKALRAAVNNTKKEIAWFGEDVQQNMQMLIVYIDDDTYFVLFGGIVW